MPRNLDLTALRAFVTIADTGGVTRAAGLLNLTQSAVSMQIKRLEEALDRPFFSRAARKLTLTREGEQLLGYARKMLALNDEAISRLNDVDYKSELRLGVPHDIVYPHIPPILKRMARQFPCARVNLVSSYTSDLRARYDQGAFDAILTTEVEPGPGGETLARHDLVWLGAPDGIAFQTRPLRLGFVERCRFRPIAREALDAAGIAWEMAVDGQSEQVVEASVAADLAITVRLRGAVPAGTAVIEAGNALPELGQLDICLYEAGVQRGPVIDALIGEIRCAFAA